MFPVLYAYLISLEGCGINLEMSPNFTKLLDRNHSIYCCWYQTFMSNVLLLSLCPKEWLKSSRLPTINDIVLFVFDDGNSVTWRLRCVLKVENTRVSILKFFKSNRIVKHNCLVVSSIPPFGHKFFCTVYIALSCISNLSTMEFQKRIEERLLEQESSSQGLHWSRRVPAKV